MENEHVLVQLHVYRPVILKLERERRATPRDMNVFRANLNSKFVPLLNDIGPDYVRCFSIRYGERYFLVNEIVVLESGKVGGAILGPGEEKGNQHKQNENLPAAQAEHSAELYTVAARRGAQAR
jgi:hypothetical protein